MYYPARTYVVDTTVERGPAISGLTRLFPVLAWPVEQVKAPALFNAYFSAAGIDARVVPFKVAPDNYLATVRVLMAVENVGGLFISIPHKPLTLDAVQHATPRAALAGACNAVYRAAGGAVHGDLTDGEGFVRAVEHGAGAAPMAWASLRALVVGAGGVGCAIAAALAERGVGALRIVDIRAGQAELLCQRLRAAFPRLDVAVGTAVAAGYGLVVNSTPLGMEPADPLPLDLDGISPDCIVADCVMKVEMTALLEAAQRRGNRILKGKEVLIEQAPLYLDLFGLPAADAAQFRQFDIW